MIDKMSDAESQNAVTPVVVRLHDYHPRREQFERTYRESEGRLLRFLALRLGSHTEAADVAQSTFLRLWQRPEDGCDSNLTALIFVTARNLATDLLRAKQRAGHSGTFPLETVAAALADEAPSVERVLAAQQDLALVRKIALELPEKCRRAFVEYKFEGRSYGEIAIRHGISESMVRKYVLRALSYCAERFHQLEGWE
ncbi:RNA polymerase sigma factor [Sphingomonas sp. AP4-R1]|uniref:RNA polymerase sigma factor n=1 Tax=Sphingomonas sp. AP4-R1 TaxID=2735134 RepID=UPI0014932D87|nr:RNA polymerase sigma factor [Sphingomonas sp. AP4-R1]QJU58223.1 RNA polymerase sigma factor [Sphingomonas sp. AP4-R1]